MNLDFKTHKFTHVISVNGKLLEVPLRRGRDDSAFIDYLTFTVSKSTFHDCMKSNVVFFNGVPDEIYIHYISEKLQQIFGFGVGEKRQGRGKFFYDGYYQLGSSEVNYGTVHIGGQRGTVLIDLTGVGCQAALDGWEERLYQFALTAERFQISRIDGAIDFFNGELQVEQALNYYKKGLFDVRGMRPKYKLEGTDWFNNDNTGKTLYVGRRGSSKFCRVYEKGKQLGDVNSSWVRFEIEFRKNDCQLLPDMLIQIGQFMSGAYEIGKKFVTNVARRVEAAVRKSDTTLDDKIYHGRNQVGKLVRYLSDMGWEAQEIVDSLIGEKGKYPDGLKPLEYNCLSKPVSYQHNISIDKKLNDKEKAIEELRENLLSVLPSDSSILLDFEEDIERWRFEENQSISTNEVIREIALSESERLFENLFAKYGKYYYQHFIKN